MRRWRLRLGAAVLLLAGMAGPGEAGEAGPVRVLAPGCTAEFASADLAAGPDGVTRGFVGVTGDGCEPDERVWFVDGEGTAWERPEVTPYRGVVLAAAEDRSGSWLLYRALGGIHLGRRTGPGVYGRPQRLAAFARPQGVVNDGDLVVSGGRWWAVWNETVGAQPGDGRPQTELFEAGTLAPAPVTRRQVTAHPDGDAGPSLAFEPGRGALTLAWVRRRGNDLVSELRLAHARPGAPWTSRTVSRPGTLNLDPSLAVSPDHEGVTLTWRKDLRVVLSTPSAAPSAVSTGPGEDPRLAPSGAPSPVGWTEPGAHRTAMLAERQDGEWTQRKAAPGLAADQTLVALTEDRKGAATALVMTGRGELYAVALPDRELR